MTEVDKGTFVHTNVSANGEMIDTVKSDGAHFLLSDWLGTRRVQTNAAGTVETTCQSQPFGDQLVCSGPAVNASAHHFTGKERDIESGLDYFGARYYTSVIGRFTSPDWASKPEAVPYSSLDNPQSLNLYSYVLNNPLSQADPDGHCCVEEQEAVDETSMAVAQEFGSRSRRCNKANWRDRYRWRASL